MHACEKTRIVQTGDTAVAGKGTTGKQKPPFIVSWD